jgi:serine/threonine-protein kinase
MSVEETQTRETAVLPPPPPDVPPGPPDPRRRAAIDRLGLGMLLGVVLLALVGAGIAVYLLTRDDSSSNRVTTVVRTTSPTQGTTGEATAQVAVRVPDLVGQSQTDARTALERDGFEVNAVTVPGRPPAGTVLAQDPPPGQELRMGQTVRINVSDGAQTAPAAPATTAAMETTQSAGAAGGTTAATETTGQTGTTGGAQTPVEPEPVKVPTLTGDVQAAVQQLADAGLPASLHYVPADAPLGTVVAQSPSAGKTVPATAHVTVNVSSGPGEKEQETVPDTRGQRVKDAVATLNSEGLRLIMLRRAVTDRSQAGTIVEQTPAAGTKAPKNAQVLVYMGAYEG